MKRAVFLSIPSIFALVACAGASSQTGSSLRPTVVSDHDVEEVAVIGVPSGTTRIQPDGSRTFSGPVIFEAKGFYVSGKLRSLTLLPNGKATLVSAGHMEVFFKPGIHVSKVLVNDAIP